MSFVSGRGAIFILLAFSSACSPKPGTAPAVATSGGEPAEGDVATTGVAGGPVVRETSDEMKEQGAPRRLSPLCAQDSPICDSILRASKALDAGETEEAEAQLRAWRDTDDALGSAVVLLRGRMRLESESLAYGEGGEAAREALVLFDSLANRADLGTALRDHVRLQRARALLALGRGEEAMPLLESLSSRLRDDAEIQGAFGVACLAVGQVDRSLSPLARAARLEPKQLERHIVLGTARMLVGEYAQAEKSFRAAIALDSNSARAYGDLGTLLLLQGNIEGGRQYLQRASLLAPTKATYVANLAYAELLGKRPQAALEHARRAIELDENLASGWLNQGLAQAAQGDRAAARQSFEKAQSLDPSDPRPKNNLRDLDEIEAKEVSPEPRPTLP